MAFPSDDPFDPDAFDDAFHDDDVAFGMPGGDGMASPPSEEARPALARALAHGETGVPMATLLRLALPLVALYGIDPADVRSVAEEPETAAPDAVALLEATRLLWAFLSLPDGDQAEAIRPLLEHLGGPEADADGWEVVHELIETTQPAWGALGGRSGAAALAPQALSFDELLQHPAFSDHGSLVVAPGGGFGPNGLSEVEARALFAQPLLDAPEVLADPDAFEAALARADAYWDIALLPSRGPALSSFAAREGRSKADRERLLAEGTEMLDRYDVLFPERSTAR